MGNALKKREQKLEMRRKLHDNMRNTKGHKRPGSMNLHKQHGSNKKTGSYR